MSFTEKESNPLKPKLIRRHKDSLLLVSSSKWCLSSSKCSITDRWAIKLAPIRNLLLHRLSNELCRELAWVVMRLGGTKLDLLWIAVRVRNKTIHILELSHGLSHKTIVELATFIKNQILELLMVQVLVILIVVAAEIVFSERGIIIQEWIPEEWVKAKILLQIGSIQAKTWVNNPFKCNNSIENTKMWPETSWARTQT